MVLVLAGCGAAVFNGGAATTAAVLTIAYTIGPVSGCHINPAITLGVWLSGRMKSVDALWYMAAQIAGAAAGSAILWVAVHGGHVAPGATTTGANAFAAGNLLPALVAETFFTFVFVLVALGATDAKRGAGDFAGLVIGLTLVLVHIVCIPVTGTSVNPARSIAPALFEGGEALSQLWVFIAAPFAGAALAAAAWKALSAGRRGRLILRAEPSAHDTERGPRHRRGPVPSCESVSLSGCGSPFFLPFSPFAERFAGSRGTARSVRKIPNVFPNRFLQV